MSRQARQQSNTGVYHVIQRGVNRMLIFHEDADVSRSFEITGW